MYRRSLYVKSSRTSECGDYWRREWEHNLRSGQSTELCLRKVGRESWVLRRQRSIARMKFITFSPLVSFEMYPKQCYGLLGLHR
ncbi:hypothetical protein AVEN_179342-1 [Araneus ventricosus]|uniref:Uncharacterized protein n=1 Tax=Araneus ventricosus TaxID=182803 RepID=A0A4Y2H1G5_ARAVE|nr:hypothetical protein AVEN_179342-1 [Araneus ventricosus]